MRSDHSNGPDGGTRQALIEAAAAAWVASGFDVQMGHFGEHGPESIFTLGIAEDRCLEVFVTDSSGDSLHAVREWCPPVDWDVRAVVPQALLGSAHEWLRPCGFDLQGWWQGADGSVVFGRVEKA